MRALVISVLLISSMFVSCDFVLKDNKSQNEPPTVLADGGKTIVGEEDEHGCTYSAAYRWSKLRKGCIRPFEEGFRLNPIEEDSVLHEQIIDEENDIDENQVSCFVIVSEDKKFAEIFLPNELKSILLEEKNISGLYSNEGWELDTREDMVLKEKGETVFSAAKTIEMNIISPDQELTE